MGNMGFHSQSFDKYIDTNTYGGQTIPTVVLFCANIALFHSLFTFDTFFPSPFYLYLNRHTTNLQTIFNAPTIVLFS